MDLLGERARLAEGEAGGHFDVQLVRAVDVRGAVEQGEVEHVAGDGAVVADEVQVVAGHLDPGAPVRKPEADHRADRGVDRPLGLMAYDLGERWVRRPLPGDTAEQQVLEGPVDPDRDHRFGVGGERVERGDERGEAVPTGKFVDLGGHEAARDRERRLRRRRDAGDLPITVRDPRLAVDDHELTVETLHGADPVIGACEHLAEREVAVVAAVHQRGHGAGLHHEMGCVGVVVEARA